MRSSRRGGRCLTPPDARGDVRAAESRGAPAAACALRRQALRDAQAAFLSFRARAREAEAVAMGGTAQPVAGVICAARLTRRRAPDLAVFGGLE
ncbi:lysozyme inhibitor LprI family protein [Jannaschia seohaensis]|uniref:lysozyme inhibitor LprI family protein n=1 Tax=Jannaschia seohaensis TaxID=475081 RepID=UPI0014726C1D